MAILAALLANVLLVHLLTVTRETSALQLGMYFGDRKCFLEDVQSDRPLHIDFHAVGGMVEMELDLFITDALGTVVWHKSGLSHHKVTLDAPDTRSGARVEGGPRMETYRFCVMHQTLPGQIDTGAQRRVIFDIWSGRVGGKVEDIARLGDVNKANGHIKKLEEDVLDLVGKMDLLKEEEQLLTMRNEYTSRFLIMVNSLASMLVMAVGALQLEAIQGVLRERKFIR